MKHFVRIIGGEWRRRRIKVVSARDLRPTSDRVRETLFNWIGADVQGAHVLDLFAGTGVLGFEALSRGASKVVFVEKQAQVASALRDSCSSFEIEADKATVVCHDSIRWLRANEERWHLVFLDPPFEQASLYGRALSLLSDRLATHGMIYIETNKRHPIPYPNYSAFKSSSVGEVTFSLIRPSDLQSSVVNIV